MQIEIWSVGKNNEDFIEKGVRHYFDKTRFFTPVELVILDPGKKKLTDPQAIRKAEEALILRRLQSSHYLILLDEQGSQHDSPGWADRFQNLMNQGIKTAVLLIGGAYGVSDRIRAEARQTWSLSRLVFPHQMVRLIVAEQVYRAYSILNHTPYHHR